jgi:UDP-N-acetylmuramoyl-tripeptide--D-alanyl-D-alanine ligase
MVRALRPGGVVLVNGDDPHARWMGSQCAGRVVSFGLGPENDVWADKLELDWPAGMRLRLHVAGETRQVRTRLLGAHQVRAVLAAAGVAWVEGIDLDVALERLANLPPTPGRLSTTVLGNGAIVLRDDFKSPVETFDAALDLLAEVPARRKVVVLGNISEPPRGGQHALQRRVGARVGEIADRFITVGDGRDFGVGARRAGLATEAITHVGSDVRKAASLLEAELEPGDVVLVKGRDTQRMERITLALQGRTIGCTLAACQVNAVHSCADCPVLERGWGGHRVVP